MKKWREWGCAVPVQMEVLLIQLGINELNQLKQNLVEEWLWLSVHLGIPSRLGDLASSMSNEQAQRPWDERGLPECFKTGHGHQGDLIQTLSLFELVVSLRFDFSIAIGVKVSKLWGGSMPTPKPVLFFFWRCNKSSDSGRVLTMTVEKGTYQKW